MKNQFEKFEKVPDSALREINAEPETNILSDDEILDTAKHTDTSMYSSSPDTPPAETLPIGSQQSAQKLGSTVSGKFAVDIADMIIPSLCVFLVSLIGFGIEKKQLSLSAKEKETLTPLVQAYLDSINLSFTSPSQNLLFGIAMIYGSKVIEIIPNAEKLEKRGKPAKIPTALKIAKMAKEEKSTDEIIREIADRRKKGVKEAILFFNKNKAKFGKENEPDVPIL